MERASPELLHTALINLLITSQPFRHGRGLNQQRRSLDQAMTVAGWALAVAGIEDVGMDLRGLRQLAEEADAEARDRAGFRGDIDG